MTLKRQTQFRLSPFLRCCKEEMREIQVQVAGELKKVQSRKRIEILPIYGGQPIDWQTKALKKAYRS